MKTFDKNIKKKLYNAEMPVSDGIWASIESQIPVKKEKPKLWFLFLLCAAAVPLYIITQNHGTELNSELIAENEVEILASGLSSEKESRSLQSILQNENTILTEKISNNNSNNLSSNSVNSQNNGVNTNFPKPRTKEQETSNFTLNSKDKTQSLIEISNLDSKSLKIDNYKSIPNSNKKLKFVYNPFNSKVNKTSKNGLKLIEKSRTYRAADQVAKVSTVALRKYSKGIKINNEDRLLACGERMYDEKSSVASCPSFEGYYSGIYFYAEANSGYTIQHLNALSPDYNDLVARRVTEEHSAIAMSFTAGIGKQWKNGFVAETGFNYDRLKIDFGLDRTRTIVDTYECVNDQGEVVQKSDTTLVSGNENMLSNSFTQVNVPLVLGYEMYLSERFSILGKAGVLVNLNSRNEGQVMDQEGNLVSYNSENVATSMFKTNLGLSYTSSLLMEGIINRNLSAYAGLSANFYPSNFSLIDNPIKQTYTRLGLTTGLKYSL